MTPAEYVEVVVLPTVREFMAKADDRRLAYLSAIAVYHVTDYLMRATKPPTKAGADAELKRIREALRADLTFWYDAIEGMANGTKHCGRDAKHGARFTPGDEQAVPAFSLGIPGAGLGEGRWHGPGLLVSIGDERIFIDTALDRFLLGCLQLFPEHMPRIGSTDWMPQPQQVGSA